MVWHASFNIAYVDNTTKSIEIVKDEYGFRFVYGNSSDWFMATKLPKFTEFMQVFGINIDPVLPAHVSKYVFRFSATTTNGSIFVLGSNDILTNNVITNDLETVVAQLNSDPQFSYYFNDQSWVDAALDSLKANYSQITNMIPDMYMFYDDVTFISGQPTYTGINDGGDDMYDGANYLNTNLTNIFSTIDESDIDGDSLRAPASIRYTHTMAEDEDDDTEYSNPPMDGQVEAGDDYFGLNSRYFTNMMPGLFVMAADNINITEFSITGNIGSDGGGAVDTGDGQVPSYDWHYYYKIVYDASDPNIHQLILIPGDSTGITRQFDDSTDHDDHVLFGLSGRSRILYALFATAPDQEPLNDSQMMAIATKILDLIPNS